MKHIDDLFKEELGSYTELPPPPAWGALENRLNEEKRRRAFPYRWLWFVSIVAAVAVTGSSVAWKMHATRELAMSAPAAVAPSTETKRDAINATGTPSTIVAANTQKENKTTKSKTTYSNKQIAGNEAASTLKKKTKKHSYNTDEIATSTTAQAAAVRAAEDEPEMTAQERSVAMYPAEDNDVYAGATASAAPLPGEHTAIAGYTVNKRRRNNIVVADMTPKSEPEYNTAHHTDEVRMAETSDETSAPATAAHSTSVHKVAVKRNGSTAINRKGTTAVATTTGAHRQLKVARIARASVAKTAVNTSSHSKAIAAVSHLPLAASLGANTQKHTEVINKRNESATKTTAVTTTAAPGQVVAKRTANAPAGTSAAKVATPAAIQHPATANAGQPVAAAKAATPKATTTTTPRVIAASKTTIKNTRIAKATVVNQPKAATEPTVVGTKTTTLEPAVAANHTTAAAPVAKAPSMPVAPGQPLIAAKQGTAVKAPTETAALASMRAGRPSTNAKADARVPLKLLSAAPAAKVAKLQPAAPAEAKAAKHAKGTVVAKMTDATTGIATTASHKATAMPAATVQTAASTDNKIAAKPATQPKAVAKRAAKVTATAPVVSVGTPAAAAGTSVATARAATQKTTPAPTMPVTAAKTPAAAAVPSGKPVNTAKATTPVSTAKAAKPGRTLVSKLVKFDDDDLLNEDPILNATTNTTVAAGNAEEPVMSTFKENVFATNKTAGAITGMQKAEGKAAVTSDTATNTAKAMRWVAGVKLGFEGSYSNQAARKAVISPYLEYKLSPKFSLMVQPGFKGASLAKRSIGDAQSFYSTNTGTTTFVDSELTYINTMGARVDTFWKRNYLYSQSRDSIVKTYGIGGTYVEVELPLLLKYQLTSKLSVYGGVNVGYGKRLGVNEYTNNLGTRTINITQPTLAHISRPAPEPVPLNVVIQHQGTPVSQYAGPAYEAPQAGLVRLGYMLGFSYEVRKRWMVDALIQQSFVQRNMVGGYNVNNALAMPYIRLSLGYRFTK